MKMQPAHFEQLSKMVGKVIDAHPTALKEYQDQGLSMECYRWYLYHLACFADQYKLANQLYQYCNDDHIDTALRQITHTT